jgi:hypothetical protein
MYHLGRVVLLGSTILLVAACAKKEQSEADTAAAVAPAPAPAPAPALALADLAGKWQFASVPMAGTDTSPTKFVIDAKADSAGWTLTFPDKQVVPLQVAVSGDSITTTSGEFKSQRRKNAKVWTVTTLRMQDGKLVGTTMAHYKNAGADSTLQLRTEGTKMP